MVDLSDGERPAEAALRDAIETMYFGYRAFTDQADRILGEQGLGRVHHRILYFVGRHPGLSVGALLEILQVSKQAIHAPLGRLTSLGLVAATADRTDRRVKALRLTPAGLALERRLTGAQMDCLAAAFGVAGASGAEGWTSVMRALAADQGSGASDDDLDAPA